MIVAFLKLLYGCRHRRITRPFTPAGGSRLESRNTYVVCLDCGTQLRYDLATMRIGKPISAEEKLSEAKSFQVSFK